MHPNMPTVHNCDTATREVLRLDLLAKISTSNRAILELDGTGQSLQVWPWCVESSLWGRELWAEYPADRPVNDQGQCVTPSNLAAHRLSHQFLGPRCLCMLGNYPDGTHKEAAMVLLTRGPYGGEYVACCTTQRCGYFGELLETSISPVLLKARWLPSTP